MSVVGPGYKDLLTSRTIERYVIRGTLENAVCHYNVKLRDIDLKNVFLWLFTYTRVFRSLQLLCQRLRFQSF